MLSNQLSTVIKNIAIKVSNEIAKQAPAAAATALVSLCVDGRPVKVQKGATLLEAINKSKSHGELI
jgi:hypothetical protein